MATFVEFNPQSGTDNPSNLVTRLVRLDNDFKLTLGIDTAGTMAYHYFSFSGIPDEYNYVPSQAEITANSALSNIDFVQLVKDGTDESLTIRVKMFYNASDNTLEDHEIPQPWTYGQLINKDNYKPGTLLDTLTQDFSGNKTVTIWNTLAQGVTPPTNPDTATAPTVFSNRLFARLGDVDTRREYLKSKIQGIIEDPMLPFIMSGASRPPIVTQTDSINVSIRVQVPSTTISIPSTDAGDAFPGYNQTIPAFDQTYPYNQTIIQQLEHSRRLQSFAFWLEMLTRAISVDTNLQSELIFNLLDGDSGLDSSDFFSYINANLGALINNNAPRTGWSFQGLGTVMSTTPFTYTKPTRPSWASTAQAAVHIGSRVPSAVTDNWLSWLRS